MSLLWQPRQDGTWIDADPLDHPAPLELADLKAFERLKSPIWIYDIQNGRMWWANSAAVRLWDATSRDELLNRDFNNISEATRTGLLNYLLHFEQGKTLAQRWTLYRDEQAISIQCLCSGVYIDDGRMAMLVEGTTRTVEQVQPDTLRSLNALHQTTAIISLFTTEGVLLMQNLASTQCYGETSTDIASPASNPNIPFVRRFVEPTVGQQLLAMVLAGNSASLEAQVATLRGVCWHAIEAKLTPDPITGQPLILVNEQDITAQKHAETALRQSEKQLELFFAQSLDGFFFMTLDEPIQWDDSIDKGEALDYIFSHQRITKVNDAMLAQYAANREDFIGLTPNDFFAHDIAYGKEIYRRLFDLGQLHIKTDERRLDGTPICIEGDYICLYNAEGKITGHFGIQRDVSDRQQTEKALKQSEARFRSMVSNLPGAVYRARAEGNFPTVFFSGAVEELTGYPVSTFMDDPSFTVFNITHPDDLAATEAAIHQGLATGQPYTFEYRIIRADGEIRWILEKGQGVYNDDGVLTWIDGVLFDVTDRLQTEDALKQSESRYRFLAENMADAIYLMNLQFELLYCNPAIETIFKRPRDYFYVNRPQSFFDCVHPDDLDNVVNAFVHTSHEQDVIEANYRIIHPDGQIRYIRDARHVVRDECGTVQAYQGIASDVTALKQTEAALRQQAEREKLIQTIAKNIRESLDLYKILGTTVYEVRNFLQADRVIIYGYESHDAGVVLVESSAGHLPSMLSWQQKNLLFEDEACLEHYRQGQHRAISDIEQLPLTPEGVDLFQQYQIRAVLVVPILQGDRLWGLLVAHQCDRPRHWQQLNVDILQEIAVQTGIGIQQAELYQQVQKLNTNLEQDVQDRTAQLQQMLNFEALLKRITDKVRDSLDEHQIVQTAVDELVQELNLSSCDTSLYDGSQQTIEVVYECTTELATYKGVTLEFDDLSDIFPQLWQGNCLQFCERIPRPYIAGWQRKSILASPILDDQGILGDLWLSRPADENFSELEIRLVQQVSTQCAIAIRQARLFQAAQHQVKELERLNQLKDDFLSTVSHELRTPMSAIKLAIELLEATLKPLGLLTAEPSNLVSRYFHVLKNECDREITLINALLDLSRLDSGTEPLLLTRIDLRNWIPSVAESFHERAIVQQQVLQLHLSEESLQITTDLAYLERVLTELLTNACKYTPPEQQIEVAVAPHDAGIQIRVSNSGVEIAASECDRIFDKFYRIPSDDPWKHGGTGLGLTLVKKMVDQLRGTITVNSGQGWTHFWIQLPLTLEH